MSGTLRILGIRGVPAAHGGFETFAEMLALHLVSQGWRVVVYCQEQGVGPHRHDVWRGIERVLVPVASDGTAATVIFDWKCIAHVIKLAASEDPGLCLTLGYNTALFCARLRWAGVRNVINMDGIEWRRDKWGLLAKAWFWLNERAGCWLGDRLVADHPEIQRHLSRLADASRITTIPYGADTVPADRAFDTGRFGLRSQGYLMVVARAEPENSVLEIVRAFSARARPVELAVLGRYDKDVPYQAQVLAAAGPQVRFLGAIYDKPVVQQLRAHARGYVHGHRVGGTNPSLVEALAAHNPVLAHDNAFNRWVAGPDAAYFSDAPSLDHQLSALLEDTSALDRMRQGSVRQHALRFRSDTVMAQYTELLAACLPGPSPAGARP